MALTLILMKTKHLAAKGETLSREGGEREAIENGSWPWDAVRS